MKIKNLKPNEILTTKDFPVHNPHILKIYFSICKKGHKNILPPTPVIPLSIGQPLLDNKSKKAKEYNDRIKTFIKKKKVKYLMLDGSHKTTALALNHNKINSVIFEKDADIKEFADLVHTGEVFSLSTKETIRDSLLEMANHFKDAKFFESIEDKTKRMVKENVIPLYMIKHYKRK
ncbi:MAG: hypothetical protein KJ718_01585 [Nanoarchaeota archaeon]|nr:hypothetical protein [Nanoarchaeota archaeon]MBU1051226.1 hypothetical protein [Nanoarchaeota archaeon]MBU1988522.1 hypothetical protein [Nanoarchaeota archaeon]